MAVQKSSASRGNSTQVQAAAELLIQREEQSERIRQERAKRRRRKRRRKREREERDAILRMHRSIEVIKWCIVLICLVWVVSFIMSIAVMMRVHSRVVEIEGQVKRIQQVIENPFASVGSRLGADLDSRLKDWFNLLEPEAAKE